MLAPVGIELAFERMQVRGFRRPPLRESRQRSRLDGRGAWVPSRYGGFARQLPQQPAPTRPRNSRRGRPQGTLARPPSHRCVSRVGHDAPFVGYWSSHGVPTQAGSQRARRTSRRRHDHPGHPRGVGLPRTQENPGSWRPLFSALTGPRMTAATREHEQSLEGRGSIAFAHEAILGRVDVEPRSRGRPVTRWTR